MYRLRRGWILVLQLCLSLDCANAFGDSLKELAAIRTPYANLGEFLREEAALIRYRQALKKYMNLGDEYDPIFAKTIELLRDASQNIEGFAVKAWRNNPTWEQESFIIKGEYTGSGLEVKKLPIAEAMKKIAHEARSKSENLLKLSMVERNERVAVIVKKIQERLSVINSQKQIVRSDKAALEKMKVLKRKLAADPDTQLLINYLGFTALDGSEGLKDRLGSFDADIIAKSLQDLQSLIHYSEFFKAQGIVIPEDVLEALKFESPTINKYLAEPYPLFGGTVPKFYHTRNSKFL